MKYDSYQKLSWKTFFITLLQNSLTAITLSFVWLAIIFLKTLDMKSFLTLPNSEEVIVSTTRILDIIIVLGLAIVLILWVVAIIRTFVKHITFYFMLSSHGISIKTGLIHINETTVPYRHIENVDINQPLIYRLFGMCKLDIVTGGEDDDLKNKHTLDVQFPIIEKTLADDIKKEMFERSNAQVVGSL